MLQASTALQTTSSAQKDLRQTQERLQLIIDHIDTITNVNNFRQITSQNQAEIVLKLKELLNTLEHLQPTSAVINMPGYEDLNDTRRKLQIVIGVLLNSLSQLTPSADSDPPFAIEDVPGCNHQSCASTMTLSIMPRPVTKVSSFSELVVELEHASAFGSHELLQECPGWKSKVLGIRAENKMVSTPPTVMSHTCGDNGGHGGKVPRVSEKELPLENQSQKQQIQHLLLQLQVRTSGQGEGCDVESKEFTNSLETTRRTELADPGNTQTNSWQLTTHPSQLAEAVQKLLEQGFNKINNAQSCSSDCVTNLTSSNQRRCTLIVASSGATSPTTTTTSAPTSLSMTVTQLDGPTAMSLRNRIDASHNRANQTVNPMRIDVNGKTIGNSTNLTPDRCLLGMGCGNCHYCVSQRHGSSRVPGAVSASSPTIPVTSDGAQKWYGENQGSENVTLAPSPQSSCIMSCFYKVEVAFYAIAFFTCLAPFALFWYWTTAIFHK